MPTQTPIAATTIETVQAEKAIPVRVVKTRPGPAVTPHNEAINAAAAAVNGNQGNIGGAPAAADPAKTADTVTLTPQLTALARKEQAFRQREQAIKAEEARLQSIKEKAERFDQLQAKIKAKDYSEIEALGGNYEDHTNFRIENANNDDPQSKAIKELKAEIDALKKGQEESIESQFEETKGAYAKEIGSLVSSNPEFSMIKELKCETHVLQLILDSWEEDQIQMSSEEACKLIEDALNENADKFASTTKFKAKNAGALPPPKPPVSTLTNNMQPPAGAGAGKLPSLSTFKSDAERYAEARRRVEARRLANS